MVSLKLDWTKLSPLNSKAPLLFSSREAVPVPLCAENPSVLLVACCGDPDTLCCCGVKLISVAYDDISAPLCSLQRRSQLSQCLHGDGSSATPQESPA